MNFKDAMNEIYKPLLTKGKREPVKEPCETCERLFEPHDLIEYRKASESKHRFLCVVCLEREAGEGMGFDL